MLAPIQHRDVTPLTSPLWNNCHGILSFHGGNRTDNVQVCATCHNANATDVEDRIDDMDPGEASVDLKSMIHGIHSNNASFAGGNSFFDITTCTPI